MSVEGQLSCDVLATPCEQGGAVPVFDAELLKAAAAAKKLPPIKFHGQALAGCSFGAVLYPYKDLVQPVKIEKIDKGHESDDYSGEMGGVVGGYAVEDPGPPPPPPPPVIGPENIAPTILESYRIAGNKLIEPDDKTKIEIQRAEKTRVIATVKLCIDVAGVVSETRLLKSSGFPAYDARLERGVRAWKYKPYDASGTAKPVCTAATFIYSQK